MRTHPLPVRARLAHAVIAACLASFVSLIPLTIAPGLAFAVSGGNGSGSATSHKTPPSNTSSTSPTQPYSTADKNNTGANNTSPTNPYISNGTGEPTGNGVRNGKATATGEPCAGCVGKADNKYPPGQKPGGGDPNAGYECDRNQGIGQTNPAHTECANSPLLTPPPAPGPSPSGCTPSSSKACTSTSPPAGPGLAQECATGNASACAALTSALKTALGCASDVMHACTALTGLPMFSSAAFSTSPPASSGSGCAATSGSSSSGTSSSGACSPAEAGRAAATPAPTGALAFTGANLGDDLAAGLALVVLGAGVLGARRMREQ